MDQARLFDLLKRGDGLVEPGAGLGLHYAGCWPDCTEVM